MKGETMYKVTIRKSYVDIDFRFDDMNEASTFAWNALQKCDEKLDIRISIVEIAEQE